MLGVAAEARRIVPAVPEGDPVLEVAAVLHDIGYAPDLVDSGFHALDGARYLSRLGLDERVCALVAHHSCAVREAGMRGLADDYRAYSDEEGPVRDALWYCDVVTDPHGLPVTPVERWAEIEQRYGEGHLVTEFIRQARPDLLAAVERTEARMWSTGLSSHTP